MDRLQQTMRLIDRVAKTMQTMDRLQHSMQVYTERLQRAQERSKREGCSLESAIYAEHLDELCRMQQNRLGDTD